MRRERSPWRCPTNAISRPSREKAGASAGPCPPVSLRGAPPSRATTKMSLQKAVSGTSICAENASEAPSGAQAGAGDVEIAGGDLCRPLVRPRGANEQVPAPSVKQAFVVALERQRADVPCAAAFVESAARARRIEFGLRDVCQRARIGGPDEPAQPLVRGRYGARFAAAERHDVDALTLAAIADEGQAAGVG